VSYEKLLPRAARLALLLSSVACRPTALPIEDPTLLPKSINPSHTQVSPTPDDFYGRPELTDIPTPTPTILPSPTPPPRDNKFCARADTVEALANLEAMGVSGVRIAGWPEELNNPDSVFNKTIAEAKKKFEVTVLVAPTSLLSEGEIESIFKNLLTNHPEIKKIELLNEYDDPPHFELHNGQKVLVVRWENQDPATAAQYIEWAYKYIRLYEDKSNPVKIIIGAQVDPAKNLEPLIYEMAIRELPIGEFIYAVHAYGNETDDGISMLDTQTQAVLVVFIKYKIPPKDRIEYSEAGIEKVDGQKKYLIIFLKRALSHLPVGICIHQGQPGTGWSVVDPLVVRQLRNFIFDTMNGKPLMTPVPEVDP